MFGHLGGHQGKKSPVEREVEKQIGIRCRLFFFIQSGDDGDRGERKDPLWRRMSEKGIWEIWPHGHISSGIWGKKFGSRKKKLE